jgi:serine/threonine-protein kinase
MVGMSRKDTAAEPREGARVARARSVGRTRPGWLEWGSIPRPLLDGAVRRLGWSALICAIVSPVFAVLYAVVVREQFLAHIMRYYESAVMRLLPPIVGSATFVVSVVLFVLTRRARVNRQRLLRLGLFYEAFVGMSLAFLHHAHGWEDQWIYSGWSHPASFIMMFAAVVPATPGRALLGAAAAAIWDPIALWITVAAGAPVPNAAVTAMLLFPTAMAVAFAWVIAVIVHRLGRDLERAEQIGSYQLVERLGEGGMGEVWRAEHASLARPAAIKLIRGEALGGSGEDAATALRRFEQEAQATAALRSPHTITLYDFGRTQDGSFYYVMELLDGIDLQALVEKHGPLPPERVVHVLRQACHSLAEAHARGLVHRDIKPANIYLCRQGLELDFVKVLDFGLVKRTTTGKTSDPRLTQEGQMSGTPTYMAPESATGDADVDARADLYALGCVAYWLLTGRTLFAGDTPLKQILAHVADVPPPPSRHAPVPAALDELVLRCLAKKPGDRPQSAEDLAQSLAALALPSPWTPERARAWWEANLSGPAPARSAAPDSFAETVPLERSAP